MTRSRPRPSRHLRAHPADLTSLTKRQGLHLKSRKSCLTKPATSVALARTTGRQRLNLHGATCLETGACPIVEGEAMCAETTIRLMERILARNETKSRINLILDNARYHHAKLVKQWLATHGQKIDLMFLPPYAPNLSSIERPWGAMHRAVTHNRHYAKFSDFVSAIQSFFTKILPETWDQPRDKISDSFHIINPQKFRVLTWTEYMPSARAILSV